MKKETLIVIAVIIVAFILFANNSSTSNSSDLYAEGQKDAVTQIKDAAENNWYTRYIDIETLQDTLTLNYNASFAEQVRDMMDTCDTSDIVNDVIDNDCSFDY